MRPSEALTRHREALRELISRYEDVKNPRVFGSVLQGQDDEDSDLDLLVDARTGTTLFTLGGLQFKASELTGVCVSIHLPEELPPRFRNDVLRMAKPL